MINYTFLFIGLTYSLFLPGFVLTEILLSKLAFWKKIPLYMVLSVIVSSYFSYFAALIFGFNRSTFFGCFLFFLFLFVFILFREKTNIKSGIRACWQILAVGILVYAIYFIALFPAIFRFYNDYFVMGGPNWQDTAMHLSIIQNLTQGNFPPQAPYFSGQPLNYYYFSDLHAAVVNTFSSKFFPQVLVILNPFLAATFFFSVFALSYQLTKKKIFSIISGVAAVFYGNLGFISLIKELLVGGSNYVSLITLTAFNFDKNYLQMTPIADYFLQNRPMMIGLPAFVITLMFLLGGNYLLAGIITAALIKFQLFGFLVSWIFFIVFIFINNKPIKNLFIFGLPTLLAGLVFAATNVGDRSIVNVFLDSFSWGPWQRHDISWFVHFFIENLGLGFILYILGFFVKRFWKRPVILSIYITSFIITAIPLVMKFTIYEFDMLKFFYYLIPLICVLLALYYSELKNKKISLLIFIAITVFSSLSSINMLAHSFFSKTEGYSNSDLKVGIWILDNTPQKSIFVTTPTVHSAPSDIGGRLRIISYINWPHSHGFNIGEDNVFARVRDVEAVYATGDIVSVKLKYGASYILYGRDERSQFPEAEKLFDDSENLKLVYNQDGIKIYEIL